MNRSFEDAVIIHSIFQEWDKLIRRSYHKFQLAHSTGSELAERSREKPATRRRFLTLFLGEPVLPDFKEANRCY